MSIDFLNGKIHVVVLDTPEQGKSTKIMETTFKCNICKHCRDCQTKGMSQCKFATYLTHKLPTTLYALTDTKPTVEIHMLKPTEAALQEVVQIIDRAKRLRMSGMIKGYYKKK